MEFYWLCEKCAAEFQLICDPRVGVHTVPLTGARFELAPQGLPVDGTAVLV